MLVGRMEVQTVHEVLHDKLRWIVEIHLLHHLLHPVQTGTLCTEYRELPLLRGFPERRLQFGTLTVSNVEHTF